MELILILIGIYAASHLVTTNGEAASSKTMSKIPVSNESWKQLKAFAEARGFFVTSTTGGQHNTGSKHSLGRAVDVRTRDKSSAEIQKLITEAKAAGITVRDERVKPAGQKVWSGAHIHLEV